MRICVLTHPSCEETWSANQCCTSHHLVRLLKQPGHGTFTEPTIPRAVAKTSRLVLYEPALGCWLTSGGEPSVPTIHWQWLITRSMAQGMVDHVIRSDRIFLPWKAIYYHMEVWDFKWFTPDGTSEKTPHFYRQFFVRQMFSSPCCWWF